VGPLKVLSTALLGLVLLLSLNLFGLALTLNLTALSADFVTAQLDRLDITAVIEETEALEDIDEYPELAAIVQDAIAENEAAIKEQVGLAINDIYDYLLGKDQQLDLALTLGDTVFDPELTISIIDDIDLSSLVEELLRDIDIEMAPGEFPVEPYLDDVAAELEPWIKEQVSDAVGSVYDYILGKTQSLNLVISLEPITEKLQEVLRPAFLESPPPELAGMSPAQLGQAFDQLYAEFSSQIPATVELVEMDPEIQAEVGEALADAETALADVKEFIGYYQAGFGVVIGLILLLVAAIVLVNRNVRSSTRILGIIFLVYGVFELIGIIVIRSVARTQVPDDVPSSLQAWLVQFADSSLAPLQALSIALIVAGAALITVSLLYKRQPRA
jgi:hypothetical protein